MGAVIDSSVLIAAERGKLDLERVLRDYDGEPIAIAAITGQSCCTESIERRSLSSATGGRRSSSGSSQSCP